MAAEMAVVASSHATAFPTRLGFSGEVIAAAETGLTHGPTNNSITLDGVVQG